MTEEPRCDLDAHMWRDLAEDCADELNGGPIVWLFLWPLAIGICFALAQGC